MKVYQDILRRRCAQLQFLSSGRREFSSSLDGSSVYSFIDSKRTQITGLIKKNTNTAKAVLPVFRGISRESDVTLDYASVHNFTVADFPTFWWALDSTEHAHSVSARNLRTCAGAPCTLRSLRACEVVYIQGTNYEKVVLKRESTWGTHIIRRFGYAPILKAQK